MSPPPPVTITTWSWKRSAIGSRPVDAELRPRVLVLLGPVGQEPDVLPRRELDQDGILEPSHAMGHRLIVGVALHAVDRAVLGDDPDPSLEDDAPVRRLAHVFGETRERVL